MKYCFASAVLHVGLGLSKPGLANSGIKVNSSVISLV